MFINFSGTITPEDTDDCLLEARVKDDVQDDVVGSAKNRQCDKEKVDESRGVVAIIVTCYFLKQI